MPKPKPKPKKVPQKYKTYLNKKDEINEQRKCDKSPPT